MSKSTSKKIGMLLFYAIITIAFVAFNIVVVLNSQKMETELASVTRKYDDKKKLSKLARDAHSELFKKKHQLRQVKEFVPELLADMDAATLESTELFSGELTTVVVRDDEHRRHGVKIYTTESTKLEVLYEVSHRIAKPKPRVYSPKSTTEIEHYEFVFPIQPKVWNIFTIVLRGRGEVPVLSIVDGESDIVGTLPEFRSHSSSRKKRCSFVGNLELDANGICCEWKPLENIYVDSSDPDALELLRVDITIRKANE